MQELGMKLDYVEKTLTVTKIKQVLPLIQGQVQSSIAATTIDQKSILELDHPLTLRP